MTTKEEAQLWKWKHIIDDNNITTYDQVLHWRGTRDGNKPIDYSFDMTEEQFNDVMNLGNDKLLEEAYNEIYNLLGKYLDIPDNHKLIMTLWIIGSYAHEEFETYPFLFLNAMKGSGKTRALKLITKLAEGQIILSLTESALFRTTGCIGIDEFESLGSKDKQALRELLNAGYKKGSVVVRMKKKRTSDGEEIVPEEFKPYRPIVMANINGMEEVLGDRCISLVLEKSNNPLYTKLIERFENLSTLTTSKKGFREALCRKCSSVVKKNIDKWNEYISTLYTLSTLTTLTTLTTQEKELYDKINATDIDGRNLELYFPLLIIASSISEKIFDKALSVAAQTVKDRKMEDAMESKDALVYEMVSKLEEGKFYPIKELVTTFGFMVGDGNRDWLTSRWMSKALKRLVLVYDKRRMGDGMHIQLNIKKAQDKLKLFS